MNKTWVGVIVIIVVVALGYFLMGGDKQANNHPETDTYTSANLTFTYPTTYNLTEREIGNAERLHKQLTLINKSEELREMSEGPTAITIDIYQNNLDKLAVEEWVNGSSDSNFKLSPDGKLESLSFAGFKALTYQWDGLYRGETVAVATPDYIYAFAVTTITPDDDIRRDFYQLLETVKLK